MAQKGNKTESIRRGSEFLSEPDLTTADRKIWNSGFPPGITVDELKYYRRKKAPGNSRPRDHLQLEEGKSNHLKSEYKRRFKNFYLFSSDGNLYYKDLSPVRASKPEDNLKTDGEVELTSDQVEEFPRRIRKRSAFELLEHSDMTPYDDNFRLNKTLLTSEKQSQYVKYNNVEHTSPIRRPSNLKLEGEFLSTTEKAEQFIEYLLYQRRTLIRNDTHLKMEGEMEKKTENREQFVPLEYQSRPPLCKKFTNLHLEGNFENVTENNDQFKQYKFEERRPLIKRATNLRLEGDLILNPEYRQAFVEFKSEKALPNLPQHNLKIDGFLDTPDTQNRSKLTSYEIHPIPFLRGIPDINKIPPSGPTEKNFKQFPGESRAQFAKKSRHENQRGVANLKMEGRIDLNPEYRNAYVDFYKSGEVSLGTNSPRRRRYPQATAWKNEGTMDVDPEYKSSFVDFPRKRPTLLKPISSISVSQGEMDHMTEKRAQFVKHPLYEKMSSIKPEPELKFDGEFECLPEYRKAYIDYITRERIERKHRPLDNITPQIETTLVDAKIDGNNNDVKKKEKETSHESRSKIPVRQIDSSKVMNKLETRLFGPKVEITITKQRSSSMPRSYPSRTNTPSPLPPKRSKTPSSRNPSAKVNMVEMHSDRTGQKFTSTMQVEDLAYVPNVSPISTRKMYPSRSSRRKWTKPVSQEDGAFFVLDQRDYNNNDDEVKDDFRHREQKWMPSWYSP